MIISQTATVRERYSMGLSDDLGLARAADLRRDQSCRRDRAVIGREVILLRQVAVNLARDTGGHGADRWTAACQQNHHDQLVRSTVIERSEPAEVRASFAASSRLPHDGFFLASAASRTEFNGALHTRLDLRDQLLDLKLTLDARDKVVNLFLAVGILQV